MTITAPIACARSVARPLANHASPKLVQVIPITASPALPIPELRQLLPLEVVMAMLDLNEDQSLALIEDGTLTAWNIALRLQGHQEPRIWRDSLLAQAGWMPPPRLPLEKIVARVLPDCVAGLWQAVTAPEIQTRFHCSQAHIVRLLALGELRLARPRSPRGRITLDFPSLTSFLTRRVMCN